MLAKTHQRLMWLDNARVVATLAVIVVHVATPGVVNGSTTAQAYDAAARFCVPVFVMLTGALVLPQVMPLSDFLSKRVRRLLLPFVLWSLVYLAFYLGLKIRNEGEAGLNGLANWVITQLVHGSAPHLWYVYMIVGIYLFIPIIRPWVITASNKAILLFLALWIITLAISQQQLFLGSPLDLRYFSGFAGYLLLGYYVAERLRITRIITFIGLGALLVGFRLTYLSANYQYLTLSVAMEAAGVFIVIKSCSGGPFSLVRSVISQYGYGIYLAHLLVLSLMTHFGVDGSLFTPSIGIPLAALICLALTALVIYLLNKLPYGKYIFG
jgi:surface polysaccharide O-acyltransferase-like enzyme